MAGGDSGIVRAVTLAFTREGADIAISYLPEEKQDTPETIRLVKQDSQKALPCPGALENQNTEQPTLTFATNVYSTDLDDPGGPGASTGGPYLATWLPGVNWGGAGK